MMSPQPVQAALSSPLQGVSDSVAVIGRIPTGCISSAGKPSARRSERLLAPAGTHHHPDRALCRSAKPTVL
jgi:hypothetical protein